MLLGCAWAGGGPPLAQEKGIAGIWVLSAGGVDGKCRILLGLEFSAAGRRRITIPRGCLRAFPLLGPVEAWNLSGDDHLEFFSRSGQTVLNFEAKAGAYIAAGPQGENFRLTALREAVQKEPISNQGNDRPAPAFTTASERPPSGALADAGGRYSILREGGKDTGCMLTLDNKGKAPGKAKASLAPGCRDQGIVIFDPAGWQIVTGRLVLTARKGHKTIFDPQPDGTWKKDPAEGKALSLRKL
ncbi:MAG: protease inhibitor Inh/omp19 family protein [Beijerinckiaceae bacterium]|nr:protease inhibitor Inh/omp19 family protein [Beijerinckiaceae bacterium]MCI0736325.1 protease inhibitor Inh/omp19 family protein [Beijerinckiaceae bacterium]